MESDEEPLSREEILRYRSLTQFLSLTESCSTMDGHGVHDFANAPTAKRSRPRQMDSLAFYYVHRFTYLLVRKKDDIAAAALVNTDKLIDAVRMHPAIHPPCKKGSVVISIQSENNRKVSIPPSDATMDAAYHLTQLCVEDVPKPMSAAEFCLSSVADVPIRTYASNLVYLIRKLRTAESKEYSQIRKVLRDYVCISSCENMKARFYLQGKNQKNYYADITRDASGISISWPSYDDDMPPLSAEDFEKLTQIVDLLRQSGQGEGLENFPSSETHWYHDIEGKMAFHVVLCRLLKCYADQVNSLVDVRNACRNRPPGNGTQCPGVAELFSAAAQAYQWERTLLLFRRMFGETALRKHLEVIALEYGLTDDAGNASDKWAVEALEYLDALTIHAQGIGAFTKSSPPVKGDIRAKFQKRQQAIRWQVVTDFICEVDFHVLEFSRRHDDQEMLSIRKLLNTLEDCNGQTFPADDPGINQWLKEKEQHPDLDFYGYDLDSTSFHGTCHCGTNLISLQLLARKRGKRSSPNNDDISGLFQNNLRVLALSEQCCASCLVLIRFYMKVTGKQAMLPVSHGHWTACSLPAWIPRGAGEHMLEKAARAALYRADIILERYQIWAAPDENQDDWAGDGMVELLDDEDYCYDLPELLKLHELDEIEDS